MRQARLCICGDIDDQRRGTSAVGNKRSGEMGGDVSGKCGAVKEQRLTFAADVDAVCELGVVDDFPHCKSAKDQRLCQQQSCIWGKFDAKLSVQCRAVEKDGLLRQPLQPEIL